MYNKTNVLKNVLNNMLYLQMVLYVMINVIIIIQIILKLNNVWYNIDVYILIFYTLKKVYIVKEGKKNE